MVAYVIIEKSRPKGSKDKKKRKNRIYDTAKRGGTFIPKDQPSGPYGLSSAYKDMLD